MMSHVRFDCNSNHTFTAYARPRVRPSEGALHHLHALNPAGLVQLVGQDKQWPLITLPTEAVLVFNALCSDVSFV